MTELRDARYTLLELYDRELEEQKDWDKISDAALGTTCMWTILTLTMFFTWGPYTPLAQGVLVIEGILLMLSYLSLMHYTHYCNRVSETERLLQEIARRREP